MWMREEREVSRSSVVPWWISWYTHRPLSEFELHSPWWVSGYADPNGVLVATERTVQVIAWAKREAS